MNWNFIRKDGYPEHGKQVVILTENCSTILGERTKDPQTGIQYWKGKSYEDNHRLNKNKVIGWVYVPELPPVAEVKKLCGEERTFKVTVPTVGVFHLWGRGHDVDVARERADLEAEMRAEELGLRNTDSQYKYYTTTEDEHYAIVFSFFYDISGNYVTLVKSDSEEEAISVALERWNRQDWPMLTEKSHGEPIIEPR